MRRRGTVALLSFPLQFPMVAFVELVNLSHTADPESSFVVGHLIALSLCFLFLVIFGSSALIQCVSLRRREGYNLSNSWLALLLYAIELPLVAALFFLVVRRSSF